MVPVGAYRKKTVESAFGIIKHVRDFGQDLLCGVERV